MIEKISTYLDWKIFMTEVFERTNPGFIINDENTSENRLCYAAGYIHPWDFVHNLEIVEYGFMHDKNFQISGLLLLKYKGKIFRVQRSNETLLRWGRSDNDQLDEMMSNFGEIAENVSILKSDRWLIHLAFEKYFVEVLKKHHFEQLGIPVMELSINFDGSYEIILKNGKRILFQQGEYMKI